MRRTTLLVALLALAVSVTTIGAAAHAADTLPTVGSAIVLPFIEDIGGRTSFHIVSRADPGENRTAATHWSYWARDCRHLVNTFVCLTPEDTKVMDPSNIQGEIQDFGENIVAGPTADVSGFAGLLTVTAFAADEDQLRLGRCRPQSPAVLLPGALVGTATVANVEAASAYGFASRGYEDNQVGPPASRTRAQTFNPETLGDGLGILLGVQENRGQGDQFDFEIGPIEAVQTCCNLTYTDNLEIPFSLPDRCIKHAGFAPVHESHVKPGDPPPLIDPVTTLNAPGFADLSNCRTFDGDGIEIGGLAENTELLVFLGEAVGPFGASMSVIYSGSEEITLLPPDPNTPDFN